MMHRLLAPVQLGIKHFALAEYLPSIPVANVDHVRKVLERKLRLRPLWAPLA